MVHVHLLTTFVAYTVGSEPVNNSAQIIREVNSYDEGVVTALKDDSSGILIFVSHNVVILPSLAMTVFKTGLFSVIVTLFIIDSYEKLSPESGSPGYAVLWVNALWFISLILTIVSAFHVMLVQEWIRQYRQITQGLSSDQRRARLILFIGTQKYPISNAALLSSLPLHLALALFLTGLIILLFTISHAIAIVVTVSVGLFGLWYFFLTILPTIDDLSPCFTPMSSVWWIIWHAFLWIVAKCGYLPLKVCYRCTAKDDMGEVGQDEAPLFGAWMSIKKTLSKYEQNLREGFRDSLVRRLLDIPDAGVDKAIAWLISRPVMDDKTNLENLLLDIPPETLSRLLVSINYPTNVTLHRRFSHLLSSCTPGTIGLDNVGQKRRLHICLKVLNDIAKVALYYPPPQQWQRSSYVLLDAVWKRFAKIDIMQPLWDSGDTAIRITARSVCALLAVHIVRAGRHNEQEQVWLQHVMDQDLDEIIGALHDRPRFDSMNIESFVLGARFDPSGDGNLPSKEVISFAETLAMLIYTSGAQENFQSRITGLIEQLESGGIQRHANVAGQLRTIFRVPQLLPPVEGISASASVVTPET